MSEEQNTEQPSAPEPVKKIVQYEVTPAEKAKLAAEMNAVGAIANQYATLRRRADALLEAASESLKALEAAEKRVGAVLDGIALAHGFEGDVHYDGRTIRLKE